MNKEQYETHFSGNAKAQVISVDMLTSKVPRTLMYGYNCDRDTFHLYLDKDGQFHSLYYKHPNDLASHKAAIELAPDECVPNKRVYPERCDFEFCTLLRNAGVEIPFTNFTQRKENDTFAGLVFEDVVGVKSSRSCKP